MIIKLRNNAGEKEVQIGGPLMGYAVESVTFDKKDLYMLYQLIQRKPVMALDWIDHLSSKFIPDRTVVVDTAESWGADPVIYEKESK